MPLIQILISGVMEKVLLETLRKLNRTELDKEVISEVGKKVQEVLMLQNYVSF
jgi:hypothetical protein